MSTHTETWSRRLWREIEPTFAAILSHPFITGLTDGTLDTDVFAHYLAQDVHYLRDYARALAIVGAKAPTLTDTAMFARHAADVLDVELGLHGTLLPALGLPASAIDEEVMPTTRAYTSYLLATAYGGGFAEGLAAILPCYWIYDGRRRTDRKRLRRIALPGWIDSYGGEEFAAAVAQVLALTDEVGRTLNPTEEAVARAHFATTSRYEWMFFDAAHRREHWPI